MSAATLTFTLPEESNEFKVAANAGALVAVIQDVDSAMRNREKYGTRADKRLTPEKVREILRYALREHDAEWALL